jgi:hypothetical protein
LKPTTPSKTPYPAELFKPVKIPKQWDLINWMCDTNPVIESISKAQIDSIEDAYLSKVKARAISLVPL